MNFTPNYNLPQWTANDKVSFLSTDGMNGAFSKIDTTMTSNNAAAVSAQSAAQLAQQQATSALTAAQNAPFKLNKLIYTPILNPTEAGGKNIMHAAIDSQKQILLLNGVFSVGSTDTLTSNIGNINIKKPQINLIDSGLVVYQFYSTQKFGINVFSGFSIDQNGNISRPDFDVIGSGERVWGIINLALDVSSWGIQ